MALRLQKGLLYAVSAIFNDSFFLSFNTYTCVDLVLNVTHLLTEE